MSVLDQTVVIDVHLQQLISSVGVFAAKAGKDEAAVGCAVIGGQHNPGSTFPLRVRLDALLCGMIDSFRDEGQTELVEHLENVIRSLKAGEPPRLITGSINFDVGSIGELDDKLELVHRVAATALGR